MDVMEDSDLRRRLREAGLRVTPARVAVLRLLAERGTPMTHSEVVERLSDRDWDRTTLFRNLADLSEAGLVRRTDLGDRLWRYEHCGRDEASLGRLPYFSCTACGSISRIAGVTLQLDERGALPASLRTGRYDIQLRGCCDRCDQAA
jgi:Fur family ferric uptake transcriptional regulator